MPGRLLRRDSRVLPLPRVGRCDSCGRRTIYLRLYDARMRALLDGWPYPSDYRARVATRENYFCLWCRRSYRLRTLADVVAPIAEGRDVYEAAAFTCLAGPRARTPRTYQISEYHDGATPGDVVDGVVHQDLRALTFPTGSLDVVVTSEVFEHIDDPWAAFAEVRRVLRVGGAHVFTVPTIDGPTVDRAGLPAVIHLDELRPEGIMVSTDFGLDLVERLHEFGFETAVHAYPPGRPVSWVFVSTAV